MLVDATGATGGQVRPQVLLTVASRFARISWKYEGMAYATTLRNVGAFYQTLWLVATAMGIALPQSANDPDATTAAAAPDASMVVPTRPAAYLARSSSPMRL